MKKYFSFAIASLLMAAPMFLSSCGDDDDLFPDDSQEEVMTEWIEPYHEKNSTPDDVKAYMASSMKNYHLVTETHSAENVQLAYSTSDINVGVLYSFSTVSGSLYSVIDTELTINSPVVIDYLQKHYSLVSSNEASLQYCFTTQDKSMVITTVKVSETCFNINYSFVY
mgnify:FL=1